MIRKRLISALFACLLIAAGCTTKNVPSGGNDTSGDVSGADTNTSGTDTNTSGTDTNTSGTDTNTSGTDTTAQDLNSGEDTGGGVDMADTNTTPSIVPCSDLTKLDPQKKKIGEPCTTDDECQTSNCFKEDWLNGFKFCTARCQQCAGDNGVCSAWPNATGYDNRCLILTASAANQSGYKAFCVPNCGKVGGSGDTLCGQLSSGTTWSCKFADFPNVTGGTVYPTCLP